MESARQKNFTKQLSAVISNEDYEFLKKTSNNHGVSIGDVVRLIIKHGKAALENGINEVKEKETV